MSTDTPDTVDDPESTAEDGRDDVAAPALTVRATGPARFSRQIARDEVADIVATHSEVTITVRRPIQSVETFEALIDPSFKHSGPTVCVPAVLDRLFEEHTMDGYDRTGSAEDWTFTIDGTAGAWKQVGLSLVEENGLYRRGSREETVVWNLHSLASDGITNDGAVLAALDLIDQHEIEATRARFTDLLGDGDET